jgi:hypothetical protein
MKPWRQPTIDHGLPIPPPRKVDSRNQPRPTPWIPFLQSLQPGDSFKIPMPQAATPMKYGKQLGIPLRSADLPWNPKSGYCRYVRIWRLCSTCNSTGDLGGEVNGSPVHCPDCQPSP